MPFALKQEIFKKYLGPIYLGTEEQEQPLTLREGLIEVIALMVVGRVNVNFCINQTPEGVYGAAIKPRLDRNYVLYENEKFTTTHNS